MRFCEYCGLRDSTHFCYGCQKWVCNSATCNILAVVETGRLAAAAIGSELTSLARRFLP